MEDLEKLLLQNLPSDLKSTIQSAVDKIIEQQSALESLRKENDLYQKLVNQSSDALWIMSSDLKTLYVSPAMQVITGYTQDEIIGMPLTQKLSENSIALIMEAHQREVLLENTPGTDPDRCVTLTLEQRKKNGEYASVEINIKHARDESGKSIGYIGVTRDISDWLQKENERKTSEAKYRALFEDAPYAITIFENNGENYTVIDCNPKAEEYFGLKKDSIIGATLGSFSPKTQPDKKNSVNTLRELANQACEGKMQATEWWHKKSDGTSFPNELQMNRIAIEGKTYLQVISRDVTKKKRIENVLKHLVAGPESKNGSTHSARTEIFHFTAANIAEALNAEHVFIGELAINEVPTLRTLAVYNKGEFTENFDYKIEGTPCFEAMRTGNIYHANSIDALFPNSEFVRLHNVKSYIGVPIKDEDGNSRGIIAIFNTKPIELAPEEESFLQHLAIRVNTNLERKYMEKILKDNQKKLSLAIKATSDAIWNFDLKARKMSCSDRWYEILGHIPHEMPLDYKTWKSKCHPEDIKMVISTITEVLKTKSESGYNIEYRLRAKDGSYKWIRERGNIVEFNDDGEPLTLAGTITDITEQKQRGEEYQQMQRLETTGKVASGVAHDFNNILTAISSYASTMLEAEPSDPNNKKRTWLQNILKAVDRGEDITKQLLKFGRNRPIDIVSIDPKSLIAETKNFLEHVISSVNKDGSQIINIESDVQYNINKFDGDYTDIQRVLTNLAVNAKEAMPNGGTITFLAHNTTITSDQAKAHHNRKPGDYVVFEIKDTGMGMDDQTRKRIFEPFYTTKTTGPKLGTGLGLSITQKIISDHKGFIDIETAQNKGSTFKLYFPRGKRPGESVFSQNSSIATGKETVLLVDDDELVLDSIRFSLETNGYKVITARDGLECIAEYEKNKSDISVVVLDLIMPNMAGPETYTKLMEKDPNLKVLLSTGNSKEELPEMMRENITHILHKPYNVADITTKIHDIINSQ